jgi:uncharacterized RDD family membrane protein YckC
MDSIFIALLFGLIAAFYPSFFLKSFDITTTSLNSLPQLTPAGLAITLMANWIYYTLFEASSWQATLGKRIMKIYVADLNGQRVTFGRAALRNISKIISSLTFLVGYFLAGFTEKKQALHDIIASCLVLRRP